MSGQIGERYGLPVGRKILRVLINNAGYGIVGALEETSDSEFALEGMPMMDAYRDVIGAGSLKPQA